MSSKQPKWSHNDLVSRIRYALNGPGYSAADAYWAQVVQVDPTWPQPLSPLLALPPELRNQIYGYLNEPEISRATVTLLSTHPRRSRPLLLTCRQLFLESCALPLTFHVLRSWFSPCDDLRMTGLTSVRWMISTSVAFHPVRDWRGAHELRVWALAIHYPLGREMFPDLESVYFKLVVERTWVKGLVEEGVLAGSEKGSFEGIQQVWEGDVLEYVRMVRRRVEVVFEYEWIDGRWFGAGECGEDEDAG